jgi:chromosome segregation ATPase
MRTTFWVSMIATALLSTAGCKKRDDADKAMERAQSTAAKAQEDVNEQRKDIKDEQKDVAEEQKDVNKEQMDVNKQQGELNQAQSELAQARERFSVAAKQRLHNIDNRIRELEARTDAAAKDAAVRLRARRDELANRLSATGAQAEAGWENFKKDVDDSFDKLEKDIDDALD